MKNLWVGYVWARKGRDKPANYREGYLAGCLVPVVAELLVIHSDIGGKDPTKSVEAAIDSLALELLWEKGGRAFRYSLESAYLEGDSPVFPGVPDGTYEFDRGVGLKVLWGGVTEQLAADHPLMRRDEENIQHLFNLGIEFSLSYSPKRGGASFPEPVCLFSRRRSFCDERAALFS